MNNALILCCRRIIGLALFPWLIAVQTLLVPLPAHALPAFARQTGQNCATCHTGGQFPELTSFGRLFKLTGYTIGSRSVPLSVMGIASFTKSRNPTPDEAFAKDAVALFQTGSVFLAGKITDKAGIFAQATYNNYDSKNPDTGEWQDKWASDNFDLRYADSTTLLEKGLIAGISLNNNPSVADPWNTAPAWIQYVPTRFGVTGPDATPIVSQLGQQAAGLGAYAFWNQTLYAELSAYRTANGIWSFLSQGTANADQTKLQGMNPYLRLALSHDWGQHSAMIGAFAMNAEIYPNNLAPTGPTIGYRDRGVDMQYQYLLSPHAFTAQMSFIKETIRNGDVAGVAANAINDLKQLKLKASYAFRNTYGASLSYFNTAGSSDNTLYPDPPVIPERVAGFQNFFGLPCRICE